MKRSFEHEVCCAYEAPSGTESSASLHRDGVSASFELLASASFNKKSPCALAQGHKNLKLFFKLILGLAELNAAEYDTDERTKTSCCKSSDNGEAGGSEDEHSCGTKSKCASANRSANDVNSSEESYDDVSTNKCADKSNNSAYCSNDASVSVSNDVLYEVEGEDEALEEAAKNNVACTKTAKNNGEGGELEAECTEYECDYKTYENGGVDELANNCGKCIVSGSKELLAKAGCKNVVDKLDTEGGAENNCCKGKNYLEALVAVSCKEEECDNAKDDSGNDVCTELCAVCHNLLTDTHNAIKDLIKHLSLPPKKIFTCIHYITLKRKFQYVNEKILKKIKFFYV